MGRDEFLYQASLLVKSSIWAQQQFNIIKNKLEEAKSIAIPNVFYIEKLEGQLIIYGKRLIMEERNIRLLIKEYETEKSQ
jgi:hypothetical protein